MTSADRGPAGGHTAAASVIAVAEAAKRYQDVVAVDRVSLRVGPGEIYALLGLNGAGKSTLIRMLLGMVRPTAGAVSLFGAPVRGGRRSVWARVGYLVETPAAYPELTVHENLQVARRLRRLPGDEPVAEVIDRLGLTGCAHRRAGTLSLGNAQRLGLAKTLLHRPELLILDEPANGLDPAGVVEIRDLLRGQAAEHGTTVFLSSHVLGEVARLATRIGIIDQGRLVRELPAGDLPAQARRWLSVATTDDAAAEQAMRRAGYAPRPASGGGYLLDDELAVTAPQDVATLLVRSSCPPTRLLVEREDLEAFFLRTVGAPRADTDA